MEINRHICLRLEENPELFLYMDKNGIPYDGTGGLCSFDILESEPHWDNIRRLLGNQKYFCLYNTIYTKEELAAAQWLTVRSIWRCGYPQPESGTSFEVITYSPEGRCTNCGGGMRQISAFRMRKTPKWGRRHFMMLNWIGDELFVNDDAKKLLSDSGLTGFGFGDVYDKTGKEILPCVNQIVVHNLLPAGLAPKEPTINRTYTCPDCGRIKYHPIGIGPCAYRREIFENAPDIVRTNELFGWEYWVQRDIIVSKNFYRFVVDNQIDRGLEFEPIELV